MNSLKQNSYSLKNSIRPAIRFAFPALVSFLLIAVLFGSLGAANEAEWQSELNQYVSYQNRQLPGRLTVESVVPARQPWHFEEAMSRAVFGDSVHYKTDYAHRQQPATAPSAYSYALLSDQHENRKSLSFPPERLWCVLLSYEDKASALSDARVVFVAEHSSLHEADLLLHEGAPMSPELMSSLSAIGCELKIGS